jgi:feruloyl esterase
LISSIDAEMGRSFPFGLIRERPDNEYEYEEFQGCSPWLELFVFCSTKRVFMLGKALLPQMFLALVGLPAALHAGVTVGSHSCEDLVNLDLPNVKIQAATAIRPSPEYEVAKRTNWMPAVTVTVPFCRVRGMIDKTIGFEVWLPANWNGKYFASGVGGYAGSIGYSGMAPALARGYATSSTDTGHQGGGAGFMKDRQALENYGYRGVHRMAETAKKIISIYYGNQPRKSYFSGCSGGGYAGLANAQRYPTDYDGVISGAPGTLFIHHAGRAEWSWLADMKGTPGYIPAGKDQLVARAVLAACDAQDGVKDGLIENPPACKFDFTRLQCPAGKDDDSCLTRPQVETVKKLYGPMMDSAGKEVYPATAMGTPLTSEALAIRGRFYAEFWKAAMFNNQWDPGTFTVDDVAKADAKLGAFLNSANPDLRPFQDHGGKLIMYHGWSDAGVSPLNSIEYYRSVEQLMGKGQTHDFFRLFLEPGMAHCGGGTGPNNFDMLTAIEEWVEENKPPAKVIASQFTNGTLVRTRPLCPYPAVASYKGTGSTDKAENFTCKLP